ncbi:hypothetical protein MY04_3858 [Flammeovirga sp. MY04]|uniref:hypothetical protein n=1 Tax=Flammeovirga sp. MY04 TaxID=1191459 RepID=UPI0008063553|nr:hypothetical protein [Flammeovirga sp. MY04]ANQ51202.1 hypothetical protein MY04_3858 [Flammeovirga sp. MY04]
MKHTYTVFSIVLILLSFSSITSKASDDKPKKEKDEVVQTEYKPLKLDLSDDGQKYIRFILWNQFQIADNNMADDSGFGLNIRRTRMLAYAQISERFMVLTHFGVNNVNAYNMDPLGNRNTTDGTVNTTQIFLHDAWGEFKVSNNETLFIGAGLHYWNGLSRMSNSGTLNFMTMDNYRQSWASLGLSDQFGRHVGVYAKGFLGRLRYQVSINEPISNALGSAEQDDLENGSVTYSGRRVLGNDAKLVLQGYFEYNFLDKESNKLPFRTGSYLGKKKVFNIGAGFFNHNNGVVKMQNDLPEGGDVNHFAVDSYYDAPVGNGAINAYVAYYNFNYGFDEYHYGTTYGTGNSFYGQFGYLLPFTTKQGRMMPYVAYSTRNFKAFDNAGDGVQLGVNWFINGHNAKLTLEYANTQPNWSGERPDRVHGLVLQTHIFL